MKIHAAYLSLILIAAAASWLSFRAWLTEHDGRVRAELVGQQAAADIKNLQSSIAELKQTMAGNDARAAADKEVLAKALAAVQTPAQALAAIPDVSSLPLASRPAVDNPAQVSVDAVPLYQELNQCRQNSVALGACQQDLASEQSIEQKQASELKDKDAQIAALKARPKFWSRVKHELKTAFTGALIGEILHIVVKGAL